jgi:hypothetical protein
MKALTCYLWRHSWQHRRNPEVGGAQADYEVCSRCGKERNRYEKDRSGMIHGIDGIGG